MEFSCAFDHSQNLFRFERLGPELQVLHEILPEKRDFEVRDRGIFVHRPDYSLHWSTGQIDEIYRREPNAKPSRDYVSPFDVRLMGFYTNICFTEYCDFSQGCRNHFDQNVLAAEMSPEGVCRVVLQWKKHPNTYTTIWFDRDQGYSPIRYQHTVGSPTARPGQSGETTWQEISGVWVPRTYLGEDFYRGEDRPLRRRMEIAFEWESVNEPVPDEAFTAAGMGLPPSTRIVSEELGRRILLGQVANVSHSNPPMAAEPPDRGRWIAAWASLVALFATGAVTLVVVVRRRKQRAT